MCADACVCVHWHRRMVAEISFWKEVVWWLKVERQRWHKKKLNHWFYHVYVYFSVSMLSLYVLQVCLRKLSIRQSYYTIIHVHMCVCACLYTCKFRSALYHKFVYDLSKNKSRENLWEKTTLAVTMSLVTTCCYSNQCNMADCVLFLDIISTVTCLQASLLS